MKSYQEVAREHSLDKMTTIRYLKYMRARWGNVEDEDIKCQVGYAGEWAERFQSGIEFQASDSIGQAILRELK
jgi:hypothetical protein